MEIPKGADLYAAIFLREGSAHLGRLGVCADRGRDLPLRPPCKGDDRRDDVAKPSQDLYRLRVTHDSKNCRHSHFGPFSPHSTLNVWCCNNCGKQVSTAQLTTSFAIQLRIIDIEQTALRLAFAEKAKTGRTSSAPPAG